MSVTVKSVDEGSLAQQAGLSAGCVLVSIDGQQINDMLDYEFYSAKPQITLRFLKDGAEQEATLEKDEYQPLGCVLSTSFQKGCGKACTSRTTMNGCPFCLAIISR